MLIKYLAKILKITPANILIVSGATGRNKSISVENIDEEKLIAKLHPFLNEPK
jgi:uncharacterized protein YggU (UPF0235/DUF167 family)